MGTRPAQPQGPKAQRALSPTAAGAATIADVENVTLTPFSRPFRATLSPPGSKSLTNRALVIAALAEGESTIENVLVADDTQVMIDGLRRLGFVLKTDEGRRTVCVKGEKGRVPAQKAALACGNSGTTIRFLAALCSLGRGRYKLDGNDRMRQRPIGGLVQLLTSLGGRVEYDLQEGYPPVTVYGGGLAGGHTVYPAARSSQYLSAVLMAAPFASEEVTVDIEPPAASWPYVEMTAGLMKRFGARVIIARRPGASDPKSLRVTNERYRAAHYRVEPDASSATYFLAAAAAHPGASVTIGGLGSDSLQGDVGFACVLEAMGAEAEFREESLTVTGTGRLKGVDVDMAGMPDAAMTLAALAVLADGETVIRGLQTLRVKETDRLAALQTELRKLGADAVVEGDALRVRPPQEVRPAEIDTYDDHRMAMSFAVVGTRVAGITVRDSGCVSKTYPGFFADLESLRG